MTTEVRPARQCTPSGGAGSTDADFTDMRTTAARLDAAGDDASGLCKSVLRIAGSLPEKSAILSPGSAAKVAGKISGLTLDLEKLALHMEFVARELRWSAGAYEMTDSVQRSLLAAVNVWTAPTRGAAYVVGSAWKAMRTRRPRSWPRAFTDELQQRLINDPSLVDGLLPWISGFLSNYSRVPPRDLEGQSGWILGTGRFFGLFNDAKPLDVRKLGKRQLPDKQRQLSDVVSGAADVEHRSGKDNSVLSVRRVVGTDGKGSWVVTVPGTTHWPMRPDHGPSDLTANLAMMAGTASSLYPAIDSALAAAMKEAGVRPGSEPVMLAGHSQGGIAAARMAADNAFRTKYDVREVVTAGAPIDRIHIPKDVNVFSIENAHDIVPHADGTATPDSYSRVNVTCEAPAGEALKSVTDAHDASLYARSSEELTRDRPEIQITDWYDRNDRFLDGSGTEYDFELRRP